MSSSKKTVTLFLGGERYEWEPWRARKTAREILSLPDEDDARAFARALLQAADEAEAARGPTDEEVRDALDEAAVVEEWSTD